VSESFLLHLMRHGEPVMAERMLGRTDSPATPAGIEACVDQASDLDVVRIISSDLKRAVACAEAIAGARPVTVDSRWREIDFGDWDGLAAAEIDPAALGRFWNDPDGAPPPNGERWSALVNRVAQAIGDLPPEPTLVVTHGGAMRAALATLCGIRQAQLWAFDLPYSAVLTFRVWQGAPESAQIVGLWP
jgi:alpha-ribazole phosphatase